MLEGIHQDFEYVYMNPRFHFYSIWGVQTESRPRRHRKCALLCSGSTARHAVAALPESATVKLCQQQHCVCTDNHVLNNHIDDVFLLALLLESSWHTWNDIQRSDRPIYYHE